MVALFYFVDNFYYDLFLLLEKKIGKAHPPQLKKKITFRLYFLVPCAMDLFKFQLSLQREQQVRLQEHRFGEALKKTPNC